VTRTNAAKAQFGLQWQDKVHDIAVMVVLGIPTVLLSQNAMDNSSPDTLQLPDEFLSRCDVEGTTDFVYSIAHIQKVYKLVPDAATSYIEPPEGKPPRSGTPPGRPTTRGV